MQSELLVSGETKSGAKPHAGGTDTVSLPTDAADTAPPLSICDLEGLAHSLRNGTATGKRRAGSVPGTGHPDCSSGIARGAGPGRTPCPPQRRPQPHTGAGARRETQGTHSKLAFPPPPSRPGQEFERHPTPTPPNSTEIPARDRGRTGVGGARGVGDFCLSFCNCARLPEPPEGKPPRPQAGYVPREQRGEASFSCAPFLQESGARNKSFGGEPAQAASRPPPGPSRPCARPAPPREPGPAPAPPRRTPGGARGKVCPSPTTKGTAALASPPARAPRRPEELTPGRARLAAQHRGGEEPQQQQQRERRGRRRLHVVPPQQLPERTERLRQAPCSGRCARRGGRRGRGEALEPTLLLLLLLRPPPGRGLGWRIPARTASRERAGARCPAAERPTRGNTWPRGEEVRLRDLLLYLVNSFLLQQLLQSQPGRLEKMARCVCKKQHFAGGFGS